MKLTDIALTSFELLNETLKENNWTIEVVLIGGQLGAYLLNDFRPTIDIDVLIKSIASGGNQNDVLSALEYNNLEAVTVVEIPPIEEIKFKDEDTIYYSNLTIYIPTIEYFALTKLFSTRLKDEDDLINSRILDVCDKVELLELIDDYKRYLLNPNNLDYNFHNLKDYLQAKKKNSI